MGLPRHCLFCRFMDSGRNLAWEQHSCAPVRACSGEDGGGSPAPPPPKVSETRYPKKPSHLVFVIDLPHFGLGGAPKGASPGLGRGANAFFGVLSCWQSGKVGEGLVEMPSLQCIRGDSVPPPITCQTLSWAAPQKVRRLALAEAPMHLFVSYHVGKV